jgi:hypothetical protein
LLGTGLGVQQKPSKLGATVSNTAIARAAVLSALNPELDVHDGDGLPAQKHAFPTVFDLKVTATTRRLIG